MSAQRSLTKPAMLLEEFLMRYVDSAGGDCDLVEPQVYDVLLPPAVDDAAASTGDDVVRLAFDPEAIPEHPGSQLASFGTPIVDRLLKDALHRGRFAELHLVGLNAAPAQLSARVARSLTLPERGELRLQRIRRVAVAQVVFWFEATFASDQKEQELMPVGIELYYGRQVRHLDLLLDPARLSDVPSLVLPELRRVSLAVAYERARDRAARTFGAMANSRQRELSERLERQVSRMMRYYADLRAEAEAAAEKAKGKGDDPARLVARQEAYRREEHLRISELRQKSELSIFQRAVNAAVIRQPKLQLTAQLTVGGRSSAPFSMIWDPLTEALEPADCPACGRSTFALDVTHAAAVACAECARAPATRKVARPR